ncbi:MULTISPECIES: hypothetical protein [Brevibacillus]|nr:hypothetical protein [Brevibacillus borstelensis]MED1743823.1 hypothetical protein [Brevibacillus borstelensis]MED1884262.1 hypothetical protein [Brevibacillus borstelensis]MED2007972.1 hypothetical protein [Brevibacillus borstelensis]
MAPAIVHETIMEERRLPLTALLIDRLIGAPFRVSFRECTR